MFRRHFIRRVTLGSAASLAAAGTASAKSGKSVLYQIKGFTCVTCAVGLETLLRREPGIERAEASYSKATVIIEFDPARVSEKRLKELISELGFSVADYSSAFETRKSDAH
jgi:copper chaperone CopZ